MPGWCWISGESMVNLWWIHGQPLVNCWLMVDLGLDGWWLVINVCLDLPSGNRYSGINNDRGIHTSGACICMHIHSYGHFCEGKPGILSEAYARMFAWNHCCPILGDWFEIQWNPISLMKENIKWWLSDYFVTKVLRQPNDIFKPVSIWRIVKSNANTQAARLMVHCGRNLTSI